MNYRMKTVCDFCKTEYSIDMVPNGPVKCAVCGNTWTVSRPPRRSPWLVFIAALCALLAAIVFAVAVIAQNKITDIRENPLVAEIHDITTTTDENGVSHFVVNGRVVNRSDQIYGVPGLVVISYEHDGNIVDKQKFMPSATLLDAGSAVEFTHVLSVPMAGVEKIAVERERVVE